MTESEFQEIFRESRERVKRTTFAASTPPEDEYEAHSHHAEYGESGH